MRHRGNVSWTQFWRASSSLRVYGGNRTTRRLAARKDWPSYKKARQNGALIDDQAALDLVKQERARYKPAL